MWRISEVYGTSTTCGEMERHARDKQSLQDRRVEARTIAIAHLRACGGECLGRDLVDHLVEHGWTRAFAQSDLTRWPATIVRQFLVKPKGKRRDRVLYYRLHNHLLNIAC
jgi:hypothetical protein